MKNNKGYIAGARSRLLKARKMLPDGYVLAKDLAEDHGVPLQYVLRWLREETNERVLLNGFSALKPTKRIMKLIEKQVERQNKPKEKSGAKAEEFVNEKGEITSFGPWLRNLDAPTSFVIDYNSY